MQLTDKYYRTLQNLETRGHGTFQARSTKIEGCTYGNLYQREEDQKQFLGKIGRLKTNPTFEAEDAPEEVRLICQIERDTIREKIAYDLYRIFSEQIYLIPAAFLSILPIQNTFKEKQVINYVTESLYENFFEVCEKQGVGTTWRVMSEWVDGFFDLAQAKTNEDGEKEMPFMDYVKEYGRPPRTILNAKKESVPLVGLMELLATARALADTDCMGGAGGNIGFVWDRGIARAVKIDPGEAFRFDTADDDTVYNRVNVVLSHWGAKAIHAVVGDSLDLRDIQFKNLHLGNLRSRVTLIWEKLHRKQQKKFITQMQQIVEYLLDSEKSDEKRIFCFYRGGAFNQYIKYKGYDELPGIAKKEAEALSGQMKTWLQKQKEIYDHFTIPQKKSRCFKYLKETKKHVFSGILQGGVIVAGGLIAQMVSSNYNFVTFSYGEVGAAGLIVIGKILNDGLRNTDYLLFVIPLAPLLTKHVFFQWIDTAQVTKSPLPVAAKGVAIDAGAVVVTGFAIQFFKGGAYAVKFGTTVVSESLTSILSTALIAEIALDIYGPEYAQSIQIVTRVAGSILGGITGAIAGGFLAKWTPSWSSVLNLLNGEK